MYLELTIEQAKKIDWYILDLEADLAHAKKDSDGWAIVFNSDKISELKEILKTNKLEL